MNKIHLLNIITKTKKATKKTRERYENLSDDEEQSLIG